MEPPKLHRELCIKQGLYSVLYLRRYCTIQHNTCEARNVALDQSRVPNANPYNTCFFISQANFSSFGLTFAYYHVLMYLPTKYDRSWLKPFDSQAVSWPTTHLSPCSMTPNEKPFLDLNTADTNKRTKWQSKL